jgi:TRAP-type uncharacterized transport system substrate-binding protein
MRPILIALSLLFGFGFGAPSRAAETLVTILTASATGIWYPLGKGACEHLWERH